MIISKDSGMEDLPYSIREKVEEYVKEAGFSDIMIVDAHNALGKKISSEEETILCDLALSSLKTKDSRISFLRNWIRQLYRVRIQIY
jgi:hypothetical protein